MVVRAVDFNYITNKLFLYTNEKNHFCLMLIDCSDVVCI